MEVQKLLHSHEFAVDVDLNASYTLQKKVRQACVEQVSEFPLQASSCYCQYNFILVVGEAEMKNRTVNVRTRDGKTHGTTLIPSKILQLTL